ncbi:MAG: DinB family protein [Gemmatimonadota bacterium]
MRPMKWFDRRFTFDQPVGIFPGVLERLRGTPARLEERVEGASPEVLVAHREEGAWSIQEHIGHLGDLEELWGRRLTDLLDGAEVMTEADLTNRRTHEAGHDEAPLAALLERFRRERARLVERLEPLDEDQVARTSLHPRLREPMRTLDLAVFVAEHDDHHLAHIGELLRGPERR